MKRIFLDHYYSGVPSGGRRIAPGEHTEDDPALFGLAAYLVDNRHAVWVAELVSTEGAEESATIEEQPEETVIGGESIPGITEETENSADAEIDYSAMTKAELAELADERGIAIGNPKNITKDEIIALLMGETEGGEA